MRRVRVVWVVWVVTMRKVAVGRVAVWPVTMRTVVVPCALSEGPSES